MKWKNNNPDRRQKWYFLDDTLVSFEELNRDLILENKTSVTVHKAIKKKYKGVKVEIKNICSRVLFVDCQAEKNGDGTIDSPYNDVKYAFEQVKEGANVLLADGVWNSNLKTNKNEN